MERPPFIRIPRDCEGQYNRATNRSLSSYQPTAPPQQPHQQRPGNSPHQTTEQQLARIQPYLEKRVCLGTASEGELKRGDIVLQIGDRDATRISHQDAHDLIKNAGNHLRLVIQRLQTGGVPSQLPASSSIGAYSSSSLPQSSQQQSAISNMAYNPGYLRTLPTTHIQKPYRSPLHDPEGFVAAEHEELHEEKTREKQAIIHQAYRTIPLIEAKPKRIHDLPMGSYLRHVHDPNWTQPPHQGATPVTNTTVMRKIAEASSVSSNPVPVFSATNPSHPEDPVSVYLRQYNSPINMYSPQAVADTLSAQTGLQPPSSLSPRPSPLAKPTAKPPTNQPIRVAPQPYNVADITLSPTYRLIHDEEWRDLRKTELKEQPAVQNRVYDVLSSDPNVNALGVPKGKIIQSGSFNTIKNTLLLNQPGVSQY